MWLLQASSSSKLGITLNVGLASDHGCAGDADTLLDGGRPPNNTALYSALISLILRPLITPRAIPHKSWLTGYAGTIFESDR